MSKKVAIIGAGGIGFDVAEYLTHEGESNALNIQAYLKEWGIDPNNEVRGGIEGITAQPHPPAREVFLMQRSEGKLGGKLGKTTGWIHRATLKNKNVKMLRAVEYLKIDDEGFHIRIDGKTQVLDVDNVIVCAGQVPCRDLQETLSQSGVQVHLIGGADVAAELDAKRAINQGSRLAAEL